MRFLICMKAFHIYNWYLFFVSIHGFLFLVRIKVDHKQNKTNKLFLHCAAFSWFIYSNFRVIYPYIYPHNNSSCCCDILITQNKIQLHTQTHAFIHEIFLFRTRYIPHMNISKVLLCVQVPLQTREIERENHSRCECFRTTTITA